MQNLVQKKECSGSRVKTLLLPNFCPFWWDSPILMGFSHSLTPSNFGRKWDKRPHKKSQLAIQSQFTLSNVFLLSMKLDHCGEITHRYLHAYRVEDRVKLPVHFSVLQVLNLLINKVLLIFFVLLGEGCRGEGHKYLTSSSNGMHEP